MDGAEAAAHPGAFLKVLASPSSAQREAAATRSARVVAHHCGLFVVPEVLSVNGSELVLERIDGIDSLRNVLSNAEGASAGAELVRRAGTALAVAHRDIPVQGDVAQLAAAGPDPVAVHGDFGLTNVQYSEGRDELVILDWAPPVVGAWPDLPLVGSAYLDLSMFIVDLHAQRPRDPQRITGTKALTAAFLEGYSQVRPVDRDMLRRTLAGTFLKYHGALIDYRWRRVLWLPIGMSALWHLPRSIGETA